MTRPYGTLAATATPFTPDDRIEEPATRRLEKSLIEAGVHGLIPAGSTGEFPTTTLDERKRVLEITPEAAGAREETNR